MPQDCLDPDVLTGYAGGRLPPDSREAAERHLSRCGGCRIALARFISLARPGFRSRALLRAGIPVRFRRAAAAVLLLSAAGGAAWFFSRNSSSARTAGDPATGAVRIPGGDGEALISPGILALPDGSRLRIGEETRARFLPPREGEKRRLFLDRGEVETDIAKGGGGFCLATPSGDIRVLGTRFTTRVLRFPFKRQAVAAAVVEVEEGAVSISNPFGETRIQAGHRGVLIEGLDPIGQIRMGEAPDGSLEGPIRDLARQEDPGRCWWDLLPLLNLRPRAARELLAPLLKEEDAQVREIALRCAAALGTNEDLRRLQEELRRSGQ